LELGIAIAILTLGGGILFIGYYSLICWLPKKVKNIDTNLSIQALKASLYLVIFGFVIIILGLLYTVAILPPPDWWDRVLPSGK
jgi:Trk-type K+ transport system membrane component